MYKVILFLLLVSFGYAQNQPDRLVRQSELNYVTPEMYGVVGNGTINDSATVANMFTSALGKVLVFEDSVYAWDKVIDIDCDEKTLTIIASNSIIRSTATNPEQEYFAFWIYQQNRPAVGAVYSTGGSTFELVDTMVTEGYLGKRISGTGAVATSGTLTKVSGTGGDATYTYTKLNTMDGRYYLPLGAINFDNATKLDISGINFEFDNSSGYARDGGAFFDGILIKNSENINFVSNSISNAIQTGLRLYNCDNVNVTHNKIDSCWLAGVLFNAVDGGLIGWNQISNIGDYAPMDGYGISISHQGGTWEDNRNINVIGNKVTACLRKGIDIHGGVNIIIDKNYVYRFGDKGISGYNTGNFEKGHLDHVENMSITNNVIENDSVWFSSLPWGYGRYGYDEPYTIAISVGSYEWTRPAYGDAQDNVVVSGNIMKNLTAYQGDTLVSICAIRVFTGYTGTVSIINNYVDSSNVIHGISVADGNYAPYITQLRNLDISGNTFTKVNALGLGVAPGAIILATAGEHINISNNRLIECSAYQSYGIWVTQITPNIVGNVKINDNHIDADTSAGTEHGMGYGIYIKSGNYQANNNSFSGAIQTGRCIVQWVTLHGTQYNNIYYNDDYTIQNLPDYTSNLTGKLNIDFYKDTTSAVDTIATMMVNGGTSFPYAINGIANFLVTVRVASNLSGEQSIYRYNAWCKNDTTGQDTSLSYIETVTFGIDTLDSEMFEGSEDIPEVVWQNIADKVPATGRLRRIDIYATKPESIYSVEVKFNGYKIMPYYMTY